jgi:hypothetical protein
MVGIIDRMVLRVIAIIWTRGMIMMMTNSNSGDGCCRKVPCVPSRLFIPSIHVRHDKLIAIEEEE